MSEKTKEEIKRLEQYLFLIKSLKDDKTEKMINDKYNQYINLARKQKNEHIKSR